MHEAEEYGYGLEDPDVFYHATAASNIPNIASQGLLPSENPNWGGTLGDSSIGKTFFALKTSGAMYYANIVFRQTLEIEEKAYIPVCLRVQLPPDVQLGPKSETDDWDPKEEYVDKPVPPQYIEIYWHDKWQPIKSVALVYWDEFMVHYSEDEGAYVDWEGEQVGGSVAEAMADVKSFTMPKKASMMGDL